MQPRYVRIDGYIYYFHDNKTLWEKGTNVKTVTTSPGLRYPSKVTHIEYSYDFTIYNFTVSFSLI